MSKPQDLGYFLVQTAAWLNLNLGPLPIMEALVVIVMGATRIIRHPMIILGLDEERRNPESGIVLQ